MGDDDHRHALVGELLHQVENLADHLGVKRARRLVEEDDLGVHRKRADYRNSLLLAAGEGGGIDIRLVLEAYALEQFVSFFLRVLFYLPDGANGELILVEHIMQNSLASVLLGAEHGREHYVLYDGLVVEKIEMLEHHSHLSAVDIDVYLHVGDIHTLKDYLAGGRILHAVEAAQEGALSGAGGAYDNNYVALVDSHIYALEDLVVPEAFFQVNYVYHSSSGSFP